MVRKHMEHSPMRTLAFGEFKRQFSDLFSVRAKVTTFERSFVESTYELLWLGRYEKYDYASWEKTVRATHYFLEQGTFKSHKSVAEAFLNIASRIVPALRSAWDKREEASNSSPQEQGELYLAYYQVMYEELMPVILAPVIVSFAVANHSKDKDLQQRDDGRINIRALGKIEKWLHYPGNRLAIGLNKHVRNAYAHRTFRILDDRKVELWDIDPNRPARKWGPEILTVDSLTELSEKLWLNALGICTALTLFSINSRKLISDRGWVASIPNPPLRVNEIEQAVEALLGELSFDLQEFKRDKNIYHMRLQTRPKGIDQVEKIFTGGKSQFRNFAIAVKYEQVPVIEQLMGCLQRIGPLIEKTDELSIVVEDYSNTVIGNLTIQASSIAQLKGPSKLPISSARRLCKTDSIGDSIMYVRVASEPVEI